MAPISPASPPDNTLWILTLNPPYANPWPAVPLDVQALKREQERERLHESLDNSNLSWWQKTTAGLLGETVLVLDAFDQYVGTPVREKVKQ